MDICTSLKDIKSFNDSILTIGAFDGMHLGHMEIINTLIKISNNKKMPSVVVTFDPNPKAVINKRGLHKVWLGSTAFQLYE